MDLFLGKSYFNKEFYRNLTELLNSSVRDTITPKENILARTPAYISYEVVENLIRYMLSPGTKNATAETPVLDAINEKEATELIKLLSDVSNDIVQDYGQQILDKFIKEYRELITNTNKQFCAESYPFAVLILMIAHKLLLGAVAFEEEQAKI